MLAMVAAADSASTVRKKYSVFIYSETEPHAMYAIYKQTLTLCVLQYLLILAQFPSIKDLITFVSFHEWLITDIHRHIQLLTS